MSHISGVTDGVVYTAIYDPDIAQADPDAVGNVTGSGNVLSLLRVHNGMTIEGPIPTGQFKVDCTDEASVVKALMALTTVTATEGTPAVLGEDQPIPADAVH